MHIDKKAQSLNKRAMDALYHSPDLKKLTRDNLGLINLIK
jgi:hypothetical protein